MKILLLTNFFPPANTVASHRLYSFAKYLPEFGIDVDIFTPIREGNLKHDLSQMKIIYSHRDYSPLNKFSSHNNFIKQLLKQSGIRPIKNYFFSHFYRTGIKKLNEKIMSNYDAILASFGPEFVLRLGNALQHKYKIPLILDYRDLWLHSGIDNWKPMDKKIIKTIEQKIINKAILVTTVSEYCAKLLENRYSVIPKVIYNGYFENEEISKLNSKQTSVLNIDPNQINICYCGSLYGSLRPIESIFPLLQKNSKYHLHIALLHETDYSYVKCLVSKYSVQGKVSIYQNLPHNLSIYLQKSCHVLLLLNSTTKVSKGVLTGKLFEYMQARKFILGIGGKDDEAGKIIHKLKIGCYVDKSADIEFYLKKAQINKPINNANISFYSRKNQAKILAQEILNLLHN